MSAPTDSTTSSPADEPGNHGLPTLAPDAVEQEKGSEIDNVVPTEGYSKLPVVGLGGSAGGLAALQAFFGAMPTDCGMAFVVILHLSPEHNSMLAELLQRSTLMPVRQVRDRVKVEANQVYVIPPAKHLSMMDGHLVLTEIARPRTGKHVAVDLFFRTLADTHGAHAAAIVFSGADGDGASGIKRVKERGGLTVAQQPDEAEQDSMPRAAITTGMVDWVLPAADMPVRLCEYWATEKRLRLPPEEGPQPAAEPAAPATTEAQQAARDETALHDVLTFLRARTGRDFTYYKRATILRRVARRMQVNVIEDMGQYLGFLRTHPGESGALLQDLLISVTNFFRDRDAFAAFEAAIPKIFAGKGPKDTVRVWVAACATGEEAYSVAMLLSEYADHLAHPPAIQVFATDLDENAIAQARDGTYPETIAADVSEERLRRFFNKGHGNYRVKREMREIVLFALHDLLKDSPFSRLDLVTCRNLLIYLTREAQGRALDIFHFSLHPEGLLFLGTSESVDDDNGLFGVIDKKFRLYTRRTLARPKVPPVFTGPTVQTQALLLRSQEAAVLPRELPRLLPPLEPAPTAEGDQATWSEVHARAVEAFGPPSVIIDSLHNLVHVSGNAGRLLQIGNGGLTADLLRLIHPTLRAELRAAIFRAEQSGEVAETFAVPVDLDGVRRAMDLRVVPAVPGAPGCLLVLFTEREFVPGVTVRADGDGQSESVVAELERALEHSRSRLRDTVEQADANHEELKAANEELQATNEELRSTSEELETGREELQSINEELTTVNLDMKSKVEELARTNSDLQNLMASTQIATIFLDRQLCIGRYTPPAVPLFNLIPNDVGRPLSDLVSRLNYADLTADAERVLEDLTVAELEVSHRDGRFFLARMRPYRTEDDRIAGVVLTFVDITSRKQAEQALVESESLRRIALESGRMGAWRWDLRKRQVWGDATFLALWGVSPSHEAHPLSIFTDHMSAEGRAAMEAVLAKEYGPGELIDGQLLVESGPSAGRWVCWRGQAEPDTPWIINGVSFDVTEQRLADERERASEEQFRTFVDATNDTVYKMSADWSEMRSLEGKRFLADTSDPSRTWLEEYIPTGEQERVRAAIGTAIRDKRPFELEHQVVRVDGTVGWTFSRAIPLLDAHGEIIEWIGAASDVTERKRSEATARNSLRETELARGEAEAANAAKDHFLAVLSHELRTPLTPVVMATHMLARVPGLPPAAHMAVETIQRNVQIEAQFIDDLLDVTRIAHGKLEITREPTNLHEAVRRAVEISTADLQGKTQLLTVALEADRHEVQGDATRLQQVFWNLLKNASKFTPKDGAIRVTSRNEPGRIVVEVTDSGIGFDAEAATRIFDAFTQASVEVTRRFGGLGLGLAISKATVDAHEGTLRAHSAGPNRGATFAVDLPLLESAPGAE